MMLPYLTNGPSSTECTDAGLTCSIDPVSGKCTECGQFEQEPQVYWDDDQPDEWTEDEAKILPYGDDTCRIIDLEQGGVIAYCHRNNANRIAMALRAFKS